MTNPIEGMSKNLNEVHLFAAIADLKDVDYSNTLAISAVIEILIEKGLVTRDEIARKAYQLDSDTPADTNRAPRQSKRTLLSNRM